jgi:hypothetical protein
VTQRSPWIRFERTQTEGLDVCRGALAPLSVFAPRGNATIANGAPKLDIRWAVTPACAPSQAKNH